jgi:predicted solute-binding protein
MITFAFKPELISSPITHALETNCIPHGMKIQKMPESPFEILEKGEAQIGIINPVEYANSKGNLKLIKEITISSPLSGRNSLLYFKGNLKDIDAIHVCEDNYESFEQFIAKVILSEVYDSHPEWKIIKDSVELKDLIHRYEIVFVAGARAFDMYVDHVNFLDLSEEWILNFELPLIHRLVVVHESFSESGIIESIKLSAELGLRNLTNVSKTYAEINLQNWDIYFDLLNEHFNYLPNPLTWESLKILFQYIFYYGESDYYAQLKFF